MRSRVFSRFQERWSNVTRTGAQFLGETYDPEKQVTAFEEVVRLLRVPLNSETESGDHVTYGLRHYVLSAHSNEDDMLVFRLIPMPDQAVWKMRSLKVTDPVTGLLKDSGTTFTTNIWVRQITKGFSGDTLAFDRQVLRYVCGSAIHEGDTLDGRLVKKVYVEQGVLIAET